MPSSEFYMFSHDSVAIKKSCKNISLMLVGELTQFDNIEIAISLLEDIKKDLISHYKKDIKTTNDVNSDISELSINIPKSLYNRLNTRSSSEKCSVDTLCVDYLSRGLSGTLK